MLPLTHLYDAELAQFAWDGSITQENADVRLLDRPFQITARKRPLLAEELESNEYDSLSIEGTNNSVVVHDGRVHRDGRTLYMVHSRFCCDRVFSEVTDNNIVYSETVEPLFRKVLAGSRATV